MSRSRPILRRVATPAVFLAWSATAIPLAPAAIISTGDVKPPFSLVDTPGSTKTFTVPTDPSSTNGGVYVGDESHGTLTIDNGWTLNSSFGIVANASSSASPAASALTVTGGSAWNLVFDLDIGSQASALAAIRFGSSVAGRVVRLGALAAGTGTVELSANSTLNSTSGTYIGDRGTGTLTAGGGSALHAGFVVLGNEAGSAGIASFTGATLSAPGGGVLVGGRGLGRLDVNAGATVSALFTNVGTDPAAPGRSDIAHRDHAVTIGGIGANYENAEGFIVGFNTRGSLILRDGATLQTAFLDVSRFGTDGTLTVASGARLTVRPAGGVTVPSVVFAGAPGSIANGAISGAGTRLDVAGAGGFFEVGRGGSAALVVADGAAIVSGYGLIATEADSIGSVSVAGVGTSWHSGDTLEVGRDGVGSLLITGGASVSTARFLVVAGGAAGAGSVTVSGATGATPSRLNSTSQAVVGIHGSGLVSVEDGARLHSLKAISPTAASVILAQFADASGAATVTGNDSAWTGDGGFNVGFRGIGDLRILDGGRVESVDGVIARLPGSVGIAQLSGGQSRWIIADSLYVGGRPASAVAGGEGSAGPGGTALLDVDAGAFVTVGNRLQMFDAGQIDLAAGGSIGVGSSASAAPGTLHVHAGGSLAGSGQVIGDVVNAGRFGLHDVTAALAVIGSLQSHGTVEIALESSTSIGRAVVTGTASLGGTLELDAAKDLAMLPADRLQVINAGSVVGRFAMVTGNQIGPAAWLAVLYAPTAVRLALAPPGDASLDGAVTFDDLLILAQHYGQSGAAIDWRSGDFNGSGSVTFDDLLALAQRYGTSLTGAGAAATSPDAFAADWALAQSLVPEPVGLVTLVGVCVATGARRRR